MLDEIIAMQFLFTGGYMQLGDMLVQEKIITSEQLAQALNEQNKSPNKKIGEVLLELGMIDIDTFTKILERQLKEQGLMK